MSGERVQFTYAAGYAAADAVNQTARRLTQQIEELLQNLGPIKADWYQSGSVAAGAAEQMEVKLRTAMDDMVRVITQFSSAITTNTQNAQQTDNTIASTLFG
jgi:uncharacterized protein YukE